MDYRMKYTSPLLAAMILLTAGIAFAASSVTFKDATAYVNTPTVGGAYITITSAKDDTLTGLSSPCCDAVELHSMTMKGDVMQMRKLDSLALKADVPAVIAHSMHLMLIGPHADITQGKPFPVTFHFVHQGDKTATFAVQQRGAKTTAGAASGAQH